MVAQRVRDASAWWLFSELARRAPHLRLRGGGPDPRDPAVTGIDNLQQLLLTLDQSSDEYAIVHSVLDAEDPKDALDRWAPKVHAHGSVNGPMQSQVLVYRVLAESLARTLTWHRRVRAHWAPPAMIEFGLESGFAYSIGTDHEWGPFSAAAEHVYNRAHAFALGDDPLHACWVLTVDERPVALIDEGGWAHDALGNHSNLARAYSSTRSVGGTYERVLAPLVQG